MPSPDVLSPLYAEYKRLVELFDDTSERLNQVASLIKLYGGNAKGSKDLKKSAVRDILTDIRDTLYPIDNGWSAKVLFTLKKFEEPVPTSRIYSFICANEPHSFEQSANSMNMLSSVISRMVKEQIISADASSGKKRYFIPNKPENLNS